MHTDEYEISLLKEVAVCSGYIRRFERTLHDLETKYRLRTSDVVRENSAVARQVKDRDREKWIDASRTLASWELRKSEYQNLHRQLKK